MAPGQGQANYTFLVGRKLVLAVDLSLRLLSSFLYRRKPEKFRITVPKFTKALPKVETSILIDPLSPQEFQDRLSRAQNIDEPLVVSATVISSRLSDFKKTVLSILSQELKPDIFFVFVSSEPFGLDEGIARDNEDLREIGDLGATVVFTDNLGPHRKLAPAVRILLESNIPRPFLITVDDDVIYPVFMTSQLVSASRKTDVIVSFRGRFMTFDPSGWRNYSEFGVPAKFPHALNLPVGRNGICYRLWQLPGLENLLAGPVYAPFADDLWIKFCTLSLGVKCEILSPMASFYPKLEAEFESISSAGVTLYDLKNKSTSGNDSVITALSSKLGLRFDA